MEDKTNNYTLTDKKRKFIIDTGSLIPLTSWMEKQPTGNKREKSINDYGVFKKFFWKH